MRTRFSTMAGLGLLCSPALAQPQAQGSDPAPEATAPASAAGTQLETVRVIGEKLGRDELETISSLGAQSGRDIEASASIALEDSIRQMANVATDYRLTIRGIPLFGPSSAGGKTISLSVDGVEQEAVGLGVDELSVWDLDRVEVLRGPQSTNQGRSALAGAVVIRTMDPTDYWDAKARGEYGTDDTWRAAFAGGGPLVKDRLAFRVSYERAESDGAITNLTLDDDAWNASLDQTLRGKLRFSPGDNYQALLTLVDERHDMDGTLYVEATLYDPEDRVSLANVETWETSDATSAALEQSFSLAGLDFTLLSGWQSGAYRRPSLDYDYTELDQGTNDSRFDDEVFEQELQVAFDTMLFGHALQGVGGVYFYDFAREQDGSWLVPLSYVLNLFGQCPSVEACEVYSSDFIDRYNAGDDDVENHAVFAEFDYQLARTTITVGGRYDRETREQVTTAETSGTTPTAAFFAEQLVAAGVVAPDGTTTLDTDYDAWLPKIGVRHRFGDDWMAGLQWQRGYRTGGVVYSYARGANEYGPEYTDNYEFALKGQLRPRLLLGVNLFHIDWTDQQVDLGTTSLDPYIVNAGRSTLQGAEIELRGAARPDLDLYAALGYVKTEFEDFVSNGVDYSGNEFPQAPPYTASTGLTWTPSGWSVDVDVVHVAEAYNDASNDDALKSDAYTTVNARLAYEVVDGLSVFAWGRNLFDEFHSTFVLYTAPGRTAVVANAGRQVGAGLEWRL